jgi:hypothetical protein
MHHIRQFLKEIQKFVVKKLKISKFAEFSKNQKILHQAKTLKND